MFGAIKSFVNEAQQEFYRVNWPSGSETLRLTLVVIGMSIGVAAFLGLCDFLFGYLLSTYLLQ